MREQGGANDLLQRLGADPAFPFTAGELAELLADHGSFTGRAVAQVERFAAEVEALVSASPAAAAYRGRPTL